MSTISLNLPNHFSNSQREILEASNGLTGTALILGVGPADDIPLEALARQFNHVHLVDCYRSSMEEAVNQLPIDLQAKCILHEVDLTGTVFKTAKLIPTFINDIPYPSHQQFVKRIKESLNERIAATFAEKASFVCSSMLSSQLKRSDHFEKASQSFYGESIPMIRELLTLPILHISDLRNWVTDEGRVYYSDHFVVEIINLSSGQVSSEIEADPIAPLIETRINQLFEQTRANSWYWYQEIQEDLYVKATISARVLSPKTVGF